jgi:hypothetical protein
MYFGKIVETAYRDKLYAKPAARCPHLRRPSTMSACRHNIPWVRRRWPQRPQSGSLVRGRAPARYRCRGRCYRPGTCRLIFRVPGLAVLRGSYGLGISLTPSTAQRPPSHSSVS